MKPLGRPSSYTDAIADEICEAIAEGYALHRMCKERDGWPREGTIYRWIEKHPDFREKYARAREIQAERMAEEVVTIADDGARDVRLTEDGEEIVDHDHIARAKLRVDARKWLVSKILPKKYGDRQTTEVEHSGSIATGAPDLEKLTLQVATLLAIGSARATATDAEPGE